MAVRIPAGSIIFSVLGINEFHNVRNEDCNSFPPFLHHVKTGIDAHPDLFPREMNGKVNLTSHFHVVFRLRMHGVVPLPRHIPLHSEKG
jgi:hypothetical protein